MIYNTRIAPSPTGYFHLGTARTAYFNWLAARASGGKFILRIDDTDNSRNDPAFIDVIYQAMKYLGLDYDISFCQSDRQSAYLAAAHRLVQQGLAKHQDGAIFLSTKLADSIKGFSDLAVGFVGVNVADLDAISNLVLIRSDGHATYHFANVVDDIDFDINYIIRGTDHISNTVRQLAIYQALGAKPPQYGHVGLLHDLTTGKKLSKSAGAPSLLAYKDAGVDSDAMCNFLLRMGWGPKKDDKTTAMLPRKAALSLFLAGGNLRSAPAKVDLGRLSSLDKKFKALKAASVKPGPVS